MHSINMTNQHTLVAYKLRSTDAVRLLTVLPASATGLQIQYIAPVKHGTSVCSEHKFRALQSTSGKYVPTPTQKICVFPPTHCT